MNSQNSSNSSKKVLNFVWGYKTDLAEINRSNYKLIFYNYFQLTTKKVAFLGVVLALNIVMTIFSKFVLGLFPVLGFFVIELTFLSVLLFLLLSNLFYTLLFLEITIWFRLVLGDEPIGLMAMNIMDGTFLILFATLVFIFKLWGVRLQITNFWKKVFYFELALSFFLIVFVSGFAVLLNYLFLLPLWGVSEGEIIGYLPIIFALNLLKYFLNLFIYFLVFKVTIILAKNFRI